MHMLLCVCMYVCMQRLILLVPLVVVQSLSCYGLVTSH